LGCFLRNFNSSSSFSNALIIDIRFSSGATFVDRLELQPDNSEAMLKDQLIYIIYGVEN
jgi:hypothetical protein